MMVYLCALNHFYFVFFFRLSLGQIVTKLTSVIEVQGDLECMLFQSPQFHQIFVFMICNHGLLEILAGS
jgi:hypothetical protein